MILYLDISEISRWYKNSIFWESPSFIWYISDTRIKYNRRSSYEYLYSIWIKRINTYWCYVFELFFEFFGYISLIDKKNTLTICWFEHSICYSNINSWSWCFYDNLIWANFEIWRKNNNISSKENEHKPYSAHNISVVMKNISCNDLFLKKIRKHWKFFIFLTKYRCLSWSLKLLIRMSSSKKIFLFFFILNFRFPFFGSSFWDVCFDLFSNVHIAGRVDLW